jgi:type III pantothenate kinase
MYLSIDCGNTFNKLGVYEANSSLVLFKLVDKSVLLAVANELLDGYAIEAAIVSNVGTDDQAFLDNLKRRLGQVWEMKFPIPVPIGNHYSTPQTLGQDRLAAACAVNFLYPDSTSLIVDIGTCIKYDIVHKGAFEGGSISPGLKMRYQALQHFTAKLPLVEANLEYNYQNTLPAQNTIQAIESGVQQAILFEIDGFISYYKSKYKDLNIILTGGGSKWFANSIKFPIFAHSDLVLLGLNRVLIHNLRIDNLNH